MSDPDLHYVVLALQTVYCLCVRQTLKMWEPNSPVEILDRCISLCDGKQTCDKSPAFLFWWWTTGLVNSLNYAMTTNSNQNIDEWSTDKIEHDFMLLFKNNREVALTLAWIISTVKTMMLACKEDSPFFVQNEIYQKQQLCYLASVNV